MSYRNVVYNNRDQCINLFTWDEDGKRVMHTCSFEPYLYVEDNRGDKTSIYGTTVKKKNRYFGNIHKLREIGQKRILELDQNIGAHLEALNTPWGSDERKFLKEWN